MALSSSSDRLKLKLFKGRKIFRPFFCSMLFFPFGLYAQNGLNFSFESFSYSEPTSIYSISGKWNESIGKGDRALSVSKAKLGFEIDHYHLALVSRYDIHYQFRNETAELIYLTENQKELAVGQSYPLLIDAFKSSSYGVEFGLVLPLAPSWTIKPSISLLKPSALQVGVLQGQADIVGPKDYDFKFISDLIYDEDPLYEREPEGIAGEGYSVDFAIQYESKKWRLEVQLLDAIGELYFPSAQHTRANASSDTKRFDENGYVIYDPSIIGKEGYKSYTYQFHHQLHADWRYQLNPENQLSIQHHDYGSIDFQQLAWIRDYQNIRVSYQWVPVMETAGLSLLTESFSLDLMVDNLDYQEMKFFQMNFQFNYEF